MKITKNFNNALILCAHTDDEFGCAGTIIKLVEVGVKVNYIAFSRCEESVPKGFPKDILEKECYSALNYMGVENENIKVNNFRVRHFPMHRQEILELLVSFNKIHKPDLVLLPSSKDIHQDHKIIYEEGIRAFKYSSIIGYELPQNTYSFSHATFFKLSDSLIKKKIDAMANYKSQKSKNYANENFIRSLAAIRGVQCNSKYAEAFEAIRFIVE